LISVVRDQRKKPVGLSPPYALFAWPLFDPKVVRKYASIDAATAIERLQEAQLDSGMAQRVRTNSTLGAGFGAARIIRHG